MIEPKYFKQIMDLTRENVKAKETVEKFLLEYSALVAVAEAANKINKWSDSSKKNVEDMCEALDAWRALKCKP